MMCRNSHPEVFIGKVFLKYTANLQEKLYFQSNFIEIALRHGRSPVNLLHIFRTSSPKNTSGRLLPNMASAMTSEPSGAASVIKKKQPLAKYTHCRNHILNLAISYAYKNQS